MDAEMERVNFLVVGIGVNVNIPQEKFPSELREIASSLYAVKNERVSRAELARQILTDFESCYRTWLTRGFGPVLEEWKKRCVTLNRPVWVRSSREVCEGWAEDVETSGALVLRLADGSRRCFTAGEVSLRPV